MPPIFKDDVIERAFTMAEFHAMSEEDRERDHDELKHYRDALNMLDTVREQGIQEGMEKGMEQALDRLVAAGIPAEQVRRLLGLG